MNELDKHFLLLFQSVKELQFNAKFLPGRVEENISNIKSILDKINLHKPPIGISESLFNRISGKTIYCDSDGTSNAMAFKIFNISLQGFNAYKLHGIRITFGSSKLGNPGITFEGTPDKPIMMSVVDLPFITADALKTPKKLVKWITSHEISPKDLSSKVDKFVAIDLGVMEMNELGLGEMDHQAISEEVVQEERNKLV